ncbi:hypothetical protein O3G_MSEX002000 [Manduca sexta]|uniref:FLYWCH-type domain-containing protein n=1 Tax=Manduca sexta TaxID=7130 RepID=A0A922CDF0_MANSE|nr:hypothetical protein O3G_MSEX002000 [Manduca sexta]
MKSIKEEDDETSYAVIISDEIPERQPVRRRCQVKIQCIDSKSSVKCFVCKRLVCNKCEIFTTVKGGQVLLLNGHRFHREYGTHLRSYWRCSKRGTYACKCKDVANPTTTSATTSATTSVATTAVTSTVTAATSSTTTTVTTNVINEVNANCSAIDTIQDNASDDDVIEVVRDEAPIEILSDGEELELEKFQQQQNSLVQNFIFTSLPLETNDDKDYNSHLDDPLNNIQNDINNGNSLPSVSSIAAPVITHSQTNNKNLDTSDFNTDNIFINVTDDFTNDLGLDKLEPNIDVGTQATIFTERNGRVVLMIGKNRFMRHYVSRQGRTRWRCSKCFNKCRAIAITEGNVIVKLTDMHNH